jgi:L-fucose mutarotase/ribose pyranase (RbsD/FucU family)
MEKNSILEKIKKIVFSEAEVEIPVVKNTFLDATLEDGTLINIEPALEVGAAVVVIDADGNPTVAEDAEHTLADGSKFVTVAGVITEILPMEEVVVEEEVPMATEPTETQEQRVKKVVESIVKESHFASEEMVNTVANELKELFAADLTKAKNEIKDIVMKSFIEFGETPKQAPTEKPKGAKRKNIFEPK